MQRVIHQDTICQIKQLAESSRENAAKINQIKKKLELLVTSPGGLEGLLSYLSLNCDKAHDSRFMDLANSALSVANSHTPNFERRINVFSDEIPALHKLFNVTAVGDARILIELEDIAKTKKGANAISTEVLKSDNIRESHFINLASKALAKGSLNEQVLTNLAEKFRDVSKICMAHLNELKAELMSDIFAVMKAASQDTNISSRTALNCQRVLTDLIDRSSEQFTQTNKNILNNEAIVYLSELIESFSLLASSKALKLAVIDGPQTLTGAVFGNGSQASRESWHAEHADMVQPMTVAASASSLTHPKDS